MLLWTCVSSRKSGLYTNYCRHRGNCIYCALELEEEDTPQRIEQKKVAIQQLEELDDGNPSETSCKQDLEILG